MLSVDDPGGGTACARHPLLKMVVAASTTVAARRLGIGRIGIKFIISGLLKVSVSKGVSTSRVELYMAASPDRNNYFAAGVYHCL